MSANPATGLLDPCICRVSVRKVSTQLCFWQVAPPVVYWQLLLAAFWQQEKLCGLWWEGKIVWDRICWNRASLSKKILDGGWERPRWW